MSPVDIVTELLSSEEEIRIFCADNGMGHINDPIYKYVENTYTFSGQDAPLQGTLCLRLADSAFQKASGRNLLSGIFFIYFSSYCR